MTEAEKNEILDDLAIAILKSGDIDLSLALEEYDEFRSDVRWQKTSQCLGEFKLPEAFAVFCQAEPDWQGAQRALQALNKNSA